MKKVLIVIIITIGMFVNVQAQTDYKLGFQVSLPDQSANGIFDLHSKLDYIYITYRDDNPATISFNYRPNQEGKSVNEMLYLTFEGDRYLLAKKYPGFTLPKPARSKIEYLSWVKNFRDSSIYYGLTTRVVRDSVMHDFKFYTLSKSSRRYRELEGNFGIVTAVKDSSLTTIPDTLYSLHPKPKGGFSKVKKKLEDSFQQWKLITVLDSALLFSGIVETNGSFGNLKLEIGEPSLFSEKVIDFIERESLKWWPRAINTTRKVRQKTKIFIRLNHDETITLSTY